MTTVNLFNNYNKNTTYTIGDVVFFDGNIYEASTSCQGIMPTNTRNWNLISGNFSFRGVAFLGDWSSETTYKAGEYVTHNSVSYMSIVDNNTNNNPNSLTHWKTFSASLTISQPGDIQYQGESGQVKLPIGTTNQVLAVSPSGYPAWASFSSILPTGNVNQILTLTGGGQAVWSDTIVANAISSSSLSTGPITSSALIVGGNTTSNNITTSYLTVGNEINEFSTDGTLTANSNQKISTQKAVKVYVDSANTALKSYVDTANTSMKSYVDSANTAMKSYVDEANTRIYAAIANTSTSASSNIITAITLVNNSLSLSTYFPEIVWSSTNTNSYGWLIQRTDNVADGVAQFALVQGGYRETAQGGCKGTLLPFQILANNAVIIGTPTTMWTNSSSQYDFSTCSIITDNKSGAFHYSGNIPWPGNSAHTMGYGYGKLTQNNTADTFYNTGTSTTQGIHNHNGQFFGVSDSDGSGWVGVNAGYASSDSLTRQHFCDFSNPNSPSITVINPGSNTSTSPVMNLVRRANSNTGNTAISGISHWRNSSNYIVARVFGFSAGNYTDYTSSTNWGTTYSGSNFYGFELSNGKTIVYHGGVTYLYTAYNSRVLVTPPNEFPVDYEDFVTACIIPDGTDSWISLWSSSSSTVSMAKFSINPTTLEWTTVWVTTPYAYSGSSYMKLNQLPNNRLLISNRKSSGKFSYWIVQKPTPQV